MFKPWMLIGLVALFGVAAFAAPFGRDGDDPDMRISVTQLDDAALQIVYEWRRPQREIRFNALDTGYREQRWSVTSPDFTLTRREDGDIFARKDGKRFSTIEVIAKPSANRLPKEYQPVAPYGAGGLLLYTGHFWPVLPEGGRVNATFDFTPSENSHVVAFGDNALRLQNWRSPMAHPAFVYMGPLAPVETDDVMALIDTDAPAWIVEEFGAIVPDSFATLARFFGFSPETKPNLFLSAPLGDEPGRLSYSGDALPAQFQITLEGGAWSEPSEKAKLVFRHSTIHEAVHLWQAVARPGDEDAPEWIHEGAADAIAAEVMVALGVWDGEALDADTQDAREECARELDQGSLNGAKARGDFRALYACGHVIAAAVAKAEGGTAASFWREFVVRAAPDGYDADLFYTAVAERAGDQGFADRIEDFARTPLADPAKAIDGLFDEAGALARERGR